jgi:anaerobic selenocysteine-containing dehydrogenase
MEFMKIDRRSFLSFIIGGAAGTALSPLPWKLTDDLSIWSQNWPWTPVPARGEVTTNRSTCTLCPGGCGITVRKVGERVVKIEGTPGHPVNDGGICILGVSGPQLLYDPARVGAPLKRAGERGSGQWQKISWDQALAEISEKLFELRSKHSAHSLACIAGEERGTVPDLLRRFTTAFGSPNFMVPATVEDSYGFSFRRMTGQEGRVGFDLEKADFLLSIGAGLLDGWGSPVRVFQANSHRLETGGKLVQVDVRLSMTAAKADRWLAIRPGTEAVLAIGLAAVIVAEGLYDRGFVENGLVRFDELKTRLAAFTPDGVAETTGAQKSDIISLARAFAGARRPLAVCGQGKGRTAEGAAQVVAVQLLNALVGAFGRQGGVWTVPAPESSPWPEPAMDAVAEEGVAKPRVDGAGTESFPFSESLLNRFPAQVLSGSPYSVEVLLVAGGNPCYAHPAPDAFRQCLDQIPLVVSLSSFMDETAAVSDYVLPEPTYLERWQDVVAPAGFPKPYVGLVQPVTEPLLDTRHAADVLMQIAGALGGSVAESFPWEDYRACLEETYGAQWDALTEESWWVDQGWSPDTTDRMEVPDIAFEPVPAEGDADDYPLLLVPTDAMRMVSGALGNPPFVNKAVPDTVLLKEDVLVEVNPKTAGSLGLSQNGVALLTTPKGSARVRVHLFEGIQPGVVALPRGLGHTAYHDYVSGKGVNYNALSAMVEDPVSGLDASWGIRAKLAKA